MAFYRCMGGNGGGTTPTSITPSNSSPAAMSSGGVYQPTANGYAIESYQEKTPSDSTPPSVSSGDIVKMGGAGYLYATQQSAGAKSGTTNAASPNGTITIDTGLSEINQFTWFATASGSYNMQAVITYDKNLGASVFDVATIGSNYGYHKRAIGSAAAAALPTMASMSGGIITLTMASGAAIGNVAAGYWFAQ